MHNRVNGQVYTRCCARRKGGRHLSPYRDVSVADSCPKLCFPSPGFSFHPWKPVSPLPSLWPPSVCSPQLWVCVCRWLLLHQPPGASKAKGIHLPPWPCSSSSLLSEVTPVTEARHLSLLPTRRGTHPFLFILPDKYLPISLFLIPIPY